MKNISNDLEDHSNQCENSHKVRDEMGHSLLSLTESRWKLRQQHHQNFLMKAKY